VSQVSEDNRTRTVKDTNPTVLSYVTVRFFKKRKGIIIYSMFIWTINIFNENKDGMFFLKIWNNKESLKIRTHNRENSKLT